MMSKYIPECNKVHHECNYLIEHTCFKPVSCLCHALFQRDYARRTAFILFVIDNVILRC